MLAPRWGVDSPLTAICAQRPRIQRDDERTDI